MLYRRKDKQFVVTVALPVRSSVFDSFSEQLNKNALFVIHCSVGIASVQSFITLLYSKCEKFN